jgi:hypothetical protein
MCLKYIEKAIFNEVIEMNKATQMKKMALVVTIVGLSASLQAADQTDGNATVTVIQPLVLTETAAIRFGDIASGSAGGTVLLTTAGGATPSGDVELMGGTVGAGAFSVTGQDGTYNITLDTNTATLGDNSGNTMDVTGINLSKTSGTISGGPDTFTVGGTLNVGANQPQGSYTTADPTDGVAYQVTVSYN